MASGKQQASHYENTPGPTTGDENLVTDTGVYGSGWHHFDLDIDMTVKEKKLIATVDGVLKPTVVLDGHAAAQAPAATLVGVTYRNASGALDLYYDNFVLTPY